MVGLCRRGQCPGSRSPPMLCLGSQWYFLDGTRIFPILLNGRGSDHGNHLYSFYHSEVSACPSAWGHLTW